MGFKTITNKRNYYLIRLDLILKKDIYITLYKILDMRDLIYMTSSYMGS